MAMVAVVYWLPAGGILAQADCLVQRSAVTEAVSAVTARTLAVF